VTTPPQGGENVPWPDPPVTTPPSSSDEFWKQRYAAELTEVAEQRRAGDPARAESRKAQHAHDFAIRAELFKAYLDVAKGASERAKSAAQFVQTAASAVGTIYAGMLALAFKADAVATRLTPRALAPALFLGLAIAGATSFLAFFTRGRPIAGVELTGDFEGSHIARLNAFIQWSSELAARRVSFLRAAVISLAVGIVMLPVPFIDVAWLSDGCVYFTSLVGVLLVLAPVIHAFMRSGTGGSPGTPGAA
jgi:hypothetical protein